MPTNQTINDVIPWTQVSASTNQTVFDTNWTAAYPSDIVVYQRGMNDEPDELTQILLDSEYVVSFVGTGQVVRVTLLTPATNGDIITITRSTPVDRLNLYTNTNFVPGMLNQDTALLTLVDQERAMYNRLSVKYHISGLNPNFSLTDNPPVVPLGPNQVWAMDPTGKFIIAYDVPEGGGIATDKAKYIIQEPHIGLPNAQAMSQLPTGLVVSNGGSGVQVTRVLAPIPNQTAVFNANGLSDNPTIGIAENPTIPGTAGMGIPSGTTAERVVPTPPSIGMRFNTDVGSIEAYISGNWVLIPSSAAGLFLPLAGGTMAGPIDMSGQIIDGLPLPLTNNEAASKIYVDNAVGGAAGGLTGNIQYNNGGAFAGDAGINTDGLGNLEIDGSLRVDNILIDGNRISPTTGFVELEDAQLFNNLATPLVATDAANKGYVDATAAGRYFVAPVRVSATGNFSATYNNGTAGVGATLTATVNGAAALNGVTLALNDRVIFPFQTNPEEGGVYTATDLGSAGTPAVYTRAVDYDEPSDIDPGDTIGVTEGAVYAGAFFMETAIVTTIGTDPITFILSVNPNVVTLDTTQTITGAKTFTSAITASSISFGGTALNAYETGTFNPQIIAITPGDLSVSYTTQQGVYQRIGNRVHYFIYLSFTPTYTTASGAILITSFPIAAAGGTNTVLVGIGGAGFTAVASATGYIFTPAGTQASGAVLRSALLTANNNITNFASGANAVICMQGSYTV